MWILGSLKFFNISEVLSVEPSFIIINSKLEKVWFKILSSHYN